MFQKFNDRQFMEAIRIGGALREEVWRYLTMHWSDYCCGTAVKRTACELDEAKEAFSIACTGVDKRIRNNQDLDFLLKASFKTYLTSATIYAAMMVMRQRKKDADQEENRINLGAEADVIQWFRQKDCREIMEKALTQLGERCKKILLLFRDGFGMKEIMKELGFANEDVAKSEKWQCQEKFRKYLRTNPGIQNLLKENCYG